MLGRNVVLVTYFGYFIICLLQDIVCSVRIVDCDSDYDYVPKVSRQDQVPSEAHDFRIEPKVKASPWHVGEDHQLSVDISWQTPPNNATAQLEGFLLEIEHEKGIEKSCFLFNVSETNWTSQAIMASPRFYFSTDSAFKFGNTYDVTLTSLPETHNHSSHLHRNIRMPINPGKHHLPDHVAENCTKYSHPYASKWTAGFRQIPLNSLAKTITVEFVGAPKQYCFEQYLVRLVDETRLIRIREDIISASDMRTEVIGNNTVYFGVYNFTDLELGKKYVPSVIPVERASDGRCLCPVGSTDPYDNTIVCSCIAVEGDEVMLEKLDLVETVTVDNRNVTAGEEKDKEKSGFNYLIIVIAFACLLVTACILHIIRAMLNHCKINGKSFRIQIVQDDEKDRSIHNGRGVLQNGVGVTTPLIINTNLNILIIYTHDSPQHVATVVAFAEYLRDVFGFEVHLDQWDSKSIEHNMFDYISASIMNADKIILVNSVGANHRYHAKVLRRGYFIQRAEFDPLDNLFMAQIDQALQHPLLTSIRFPYSSPADVIPTVRERLQFVIPDNLTLMLSGITEHCLKNDARLAKSGSQLAKVQDAISRMQAFQEAQPDWFDKTHVRVPVPTSPVKTVTPPRMDHDNLPVVVRSQPVLPTEVASTQPLLSNEEQNGTADDDSGVFDKSGVHPVTTVDVIDESEEAEVSGEVAASIALAQIQPQTSYEQEDENVDSAMNTMDTFDTTGTHFDSDVEEAVPKVIIPPRIETAFTDFKKFGEYDSNGDSGMISDADLRLTAS
uniref:SEFIR domain-containing protein n=1 Tax=Panagrellus redivivus TaxID=6233 RepID=A0A7E4W5Q7_PANRE